MCVTHYLYLLQFYLILGQFGLCYEKVINLTGLFQLITSKRIKSFACLTRINNWQLIWLIFLLKKHHLWYIPPVCCCETVLWNINLQRTLYLYHLSKEHCCWSPHSQDHLCSIFRLDQFPYWWCLSYLLPACSCFTFGENTTEHRSVNLISEHHRKVKTNRQSSAHPH